MVLVMSSGPPLQTSGELEVGTIDSVAGLFALEDEWRALEERVLRFPFLTFDWCLAWWEHFAERRLLVTDSLSVLSFRDSRGVLVGIAPLMLTRAPGFEALSVRQLQLFGADPNVTEIRSLVVGPEHEAQVYAALMRHLQLQSRQWDWLLLNGVSDDPALTSIIEKSFPRVQWRRALPNYTLALPKTFAEFKSSRSRNIKESLRKCYNSLKRDGLTFEFRVLTSAAEVDLALTDLFRLHRLRSQLTDTVAHPDTFAAASSRRFLRALCQRLALRGRVRLFQLVIDGQVVAARVAFVCQDCLYFYYSGYEPAFRRYSVMTTLLAEALRYAIEQGLTSANLATGRDVGKQRWSPQERMYRDVLLVSPSLRGGIAYGACALAKQVVAAAQERTTLFDWLGRRAEPRAARPTPEDARTQSQAPPPPAPDRLAAE
jgi:CelD/BcsL family acetyltransferase involved in cellulose biosynthesis